MSQIPDAWELLRQRCQVCTACELCKTRNKLVFGVGRQDSPILFVGEGPGQQEDLQGEPFVGAAGKLLDDMLSIIDLGRDNCYIANVVKCRPPGNRDPKVEEQAACGIQKNGIWYTAIYHPSALLRDLNRRPETFLDLLSIRDKINEVCPEFYQ